MARQARIDLQQRASSKQRETRKEDIKMAAKKAATIAATAAATAMAPTDSEAIVESPPAKMKDTTQTLHGEVTVMAFRLQGDLLLVHQWGQKAVLEMLAKMAGHPVPKLPKDLTVEGDASAYRNMLGQDVMPCRIIKACFVNGASQTNKAVKSHEMNKHVRVIGHTAPLHFESVDRCDVEPVKVGPWNERVVDLRARTMYSNWHCDVVVQFPQTIIGKEKVIAAMRAAGLCVGLCEKRIEKGFELGGFEIKSLPVTAIDAILQANRSPEKRFAIPEELLHAASAQLEDADKRNPKKKAMAVVMGVNGAEARHELDAIAQARALLEDNGFAVKQLREEDLNGSHGETIESRETAESVASDAADEETTS